MPRLSIHCLPFLPRIMAQHLLLFSLRFMSKYILAVKQSECLAHIIRQQASVSSSLLS